MRKTEKLEHILYSFWLFKFWIPEGAGSLRTFYVLARYVLCILEKFYQMVDKDKSGFADENELQQAVFWVSEGLILGLLIAYVSLRESK